MKEYNGFTEENVLNVLSAHTKGDDPDEWVKSIRNSLKFIIAEEHLTLKRDFKRTYDLYWEVYKRINSLIRYTEGL